jgi:hypothetical protein
MTTQVQKSGNPAIRPPSGGPMMDWEGEQLAGELTVSCEALRLKIRIREEAACNVHTRSPASVYKQIVPKKRSTIDNSSVVESESWSCEYLRILAATMSDGGFGLKVSQCPGSFCSRIVAHKKHLSTNRVVLFVPKSSSAGHRTARISGKEYECSCSKIYDLSTAVWSTVCNIV